MFSKNTVELKTTFRVFRNITSLNLVLLASPAVPVLRNCSRLVLLLHWESGIVAWLFDWRLGRVRAQRAANGLSLPRLFRRFPSYTRLHVQVRDFFGTKTASMPCRSWTVSKLVYLRNIEGS